jgi:hypothetical protein
VFVEDAEITLASAAALWGCDDLATEDLCTALNDLSLLRHLDLGRSVLQVHDVFRELVRSRLGPAGVRKLDARLVAAWRQTCHAQWADLRDAYALRYLPVHLRGAGRDDALTALLLSVG